LLTSKQNQMDRREFLARGAVGLSVAAAARQMAGASAGQRFRIGMAATTYLTASPSTATYWQACEALAGIGIGATEADNGEAHLDDVYGNKIADFKTKSSEAGIALVGVYQGLPLHDTSSLPQMRKKLGAVAQFLKAAGAEYIALGWDAPGRNGQPYQRTRADVRNAVRTMNEFGRLSSGNYGISIAYHAERDTNKETILQVLDDTDARYVHWCADVGHLTATGLDALATVRKYASRLRASHWKDFDPKLKAPQYLGPGASGDFVELGRGIIDFPALAQLYLDLGYDRWVMIELDRTRQKKLDSQREMQTYVTDRLRLKIFPARKPAA
jgi:inosose dehydratase